jgi:hypothetical protein
VTASRSGQADEAKPWPGNSAHPEHIQLFCGQSHRASFKIQRITHGQKRGSLMNEVMPASTLLAIGLPPIGFIIAIICIYLSKTEED